MNIPWTDNEPRTPEHDALDAEWKAILTADVVPSRCHRALPLDVVEAKARADRKPWTEQHDNGALGDSNWIPVVVDRVREEFDEEDQSVSADREVGRYLLRFVGVLLGAAFCVWLIAGGPDSDALAVLLALGEKP